MHSVFATTKGTLTGQSFGYLDYLDAALPARNEVQVYTRLRPTHFRLLNDLGRALDLDMSIDDAHGKPYTQH